MKLKRIEDVHLFERELESCKGDVWLISSDGNLRYNVRSALSRYVALAELVSDNDLELFADDKEDEYKLIKFIADNPGILDDKDN